MGEATNKSCGKCGGEITPGQIVERRAGLVGGVLLCPNCVEMKRRVAMQARVPATEASSPQATAAQNQPARAAAPGDDQDKLISLVSDDELPTSASQVIRSFATGSSLSGAHHDEKLKRPITSPNEPATRCRTFHAKLTQAGIANLDDLLNEWLDQQESVYIKNVTSSIGIFEGKSKEQHMFLTVFY